jgi:hypothetical protein
VVKAINKRCSKDLQAAADGYCKFWVKGCCIGWRIKSITLEADAVNKIKRDKFKEMISILILSPFYFSMPLRRRLELIHELMERYLGAHLS